MAGLILCGGVGLIAGALLGGLLVQLAQSRFEATSILTHLVRGEDDAVVLTWRRQGLFPSTGLHVSVTQHRLDPTEALELANDILQACKQTRRYRPPRRVELLPDPGEMH